jgi:hypothetical protein
MFDGHLRQAKVNAPRPCDAHRPEAAKRLAMEAIILHSRGFSCELASHDANQKY